MTSQQVDAKRVSRRVGISDTYRHDGEVKDVLPKCGHWSLEA
jgi:hypothetical protein